MRTYVRNIYGFCILACNTLIVVAGDFDAYLVKLSKSEG